MNLLFNLIFSEKSARFQEQFTIDHFAGGVTYNSTNFLEKNKDTLSVDLIKALNTSSHRIIIESWNKDGMRFKNALKE